MRWNYAQQFIIAGWKRRSYPEHILICRAAISVRPDKCVMFFYSLGGHLKEVNTVECWVLPSCTFILSTFLKPLRNTVHFRKKNLKLFLSNVNISAKHVARNICWCARNEKIPVLLLKTDVVSSLYSCTLSREDWMISLRWFVHGIE